MTENEAKEWIKYLGNQNLPYDRSPKSRKLACDIAIQALEENQQYRAIGTIEEFKALKEKNEPKKVVVEHIPKTSWTKEISHYLCPSCRSIFSFGGKPYCSNCGQKIDWQ